MITLTEKAAIHAKNLLAQGGIGICIGIKRIGCAGLGYTIEILETPSPLKLHQFNSNGINIYVKESDIAYLDETIIDFKQDTFSNGFVYLNPHVVSNCGCGESFAVS